jgi:hypothetical protein
MQYALLIYSTEKLMTDMSPTDGQRLTSEYGAFTKELRGSGHMKAGEALQPTTTATTVRVRDGKTQVTDGPFAETREQLGGFYLIEAKDLDEATKIAARIPSAKFGAIEIRPVVVFAPGTM